MKRYLKFCFPLLLLFVLPALVLAGKEKVIRVVDGDTIVVNYKGKPEKVRLLRVNTPESVHPDKKQNITLGKVASQYTYKRLHGKYVDLEFEGPFRGRYGRMLAYIHVDGINFNLELVKQGLSPYYTRYGHSEKYHDKFKKAERHARSRHLGIWANPNLTQKYLRLKSKWGQSASKIERMPPTKGTDKGKNTHGR